MIVASEISFVFAPFDLGTNLFPSLIESSGRVIAVIVMQPVILVVVPMMVVVMIIVVIVRGAACGHGLC